MLKAYYENMDSKQLESIYIHKTANFQMIRDQLYREEVLPEIMLIRGILQSRGIYVA